MREEVTCNVSVEGVIILKWISENHGLRKGLLIIGQVL
jgi:hypothetical protein